MREDRLKYVMSRQVCWQLHHRQHQARGTLGNRADEMLLKCFLFWAFVWFAFGNISQHFQIQAFWHPPNTHKQMKPLHTAVTEVSPCVQAGYWLSLPDTLLRKREVFQPLLSITFHEGKPPIQVFPWSSKSHLEKYAVLLCGAEHWKRDHDGLGLAGWNQLTMVWQQNGFGMYLSVPTRCNFV